MMRGPTNIRCEVNRMQKFIKQHMKGFSKNFQNFSVVVWGTIQTIEGLLIRIAHEIPFVLELRGDELSFKFMIFDYITLSEPSILVCYTVLIDKQVSTFQRILIF